MICEKLEQSCQWLGTRETTRGTPTTKRQEPEFTKYSKRWKAGSVPLGKVLGTSKIRMFKGNDKIPRTNAKKKEKFKQTQRCDCHMQGK